MISFFLQGLQHPFITPAHLIIVIALAVLLGQQVRKSIFSTMLSLIICTAVGLFLSRHYQVGFNLEILLLSLAVIISLLVTLKLLLPQWFMIFLAVIVGVIIGLDSSPVMIPGLKVSNIYLNMLGSWISISSLLIIVGLLAILVNSIAQGIALRVIGSWIFASALMVLVFIFAPADTVTLQSATEPINKQVGL